MRRLIVGLIGVVAVSLTGCMGLVRELRCDPSVVGFTGFWAELGFSPNPGAAFLPLPSLRVGHGTTWRIGTHDSVAVTSGTETALSAGTPSVTGGPEAKPPTSRGMGSLNITASGIEGLKSLCRPPDGTLQDKPS